MPSLRKAALPGSCNLPEQLGMTPSRRRGTMRSRMNRAREVEVNKASMLCRLSGKLAMSLRQVSSGKEEETRTPKPFIETLRVRIPPGKAGPAARSESCVAVGRPTLRSVDSQVKGRVIEPRKLKTRGAFVLDISGGRVRQLTHGPLSLPDPAGVYSGPPKVDHPGHLHLLKLFPFQPP